MSWDRYALGQKNIFYDENPSLLIDDVFPPHVQRLRASITDFSCVVNGKCLVPALISDITLTPFLNCANPDPALEVAQKALNEFKSLVGAGYPENEWQSLYETYFFDKLDDSLSLFKHDSRRVSRSKYYYDAVKRCIDKSWGLFEKDKPIGIGSFESYSCPKPDQAYFLPIYHDQSTAGIPIVVDPQARQWNQSQALSVTEPFMWSTLKELHGFGLQPTPFNIFHKQPLEAYLRCYPWLVVEHKTESEKGDMLVRDVSCQTANAAACAVSLIRNAAQYAAKLHKHAHISPIPAITTVGPSVTVWIMYYAENFDAPCEREKTKEVTTKKRKKGYVMRKIWNGSMTNLADIVKFQMIIDNMHIWATRVFKPLISSYIEQWQYAHSRSHLNPVSNQSLFSQSETRRQTAIQRRTEVLAVVQDLLEDHAALEFDGMAHAKVTPLLLGLFMHQVRSSERQFISDEVDRLVSQRLEGLSLRGVVPRMRFEHIRSERFTTRVSPSSHPAYEESSVSSQKSTQSPIPDNNDPNDLDYEPSQDLLTPGLSSGHSRHQIPETEVAEGLSSESDFGATTIIWAAKQPATPQSRANGNRAPRRRSKSVREHTSLSDNSDEETPKAGTTRTLNPLDHVPRSPRSPSQNLRREMSTANAPSGSPVFAGQPPPGGRTWSPGRQFGQPRPPKSPRPRSAQTGSGENREARGAAQDEMGYIDLTRDSQDDTS